jgi:uncharacterized phage protein (predicted DNA packaging)
MIDLFTIKDYLRVDHDLDDASIEGLIEAAESYILSLCRDFDDDMPPEIRQAILILVSHWYDNRALVSKDRQQEIPFAVSALIANYRDFSAGDPDDE